MGGGYGTSGAISSVVIYNPSTDGWTATNTTNAPAARYRHTAVWTSREMIVWGGADTSNYFNTGGGDCAPPRPPPTPTPPLSPTSTVPATPTTPATTTATTTAHPNTN